MKTTFKLITGLWLLITVPFAWANGSCINENISIPFSTPTTDFTLHNNGTVTHSTTGLMWMRCSLGQTWDGTSCNGSASVYTWQNALLQNGTRYASYNDWRLPNKNELASIVEQRCWSPGINTMMFPGTATGWFWSSSAVSGVVNDAWGVDFSVGAVNGANKAGNGQVRLVRAGQ